MSRLGKHLFDEQGVGEEDALSNARSGFDSDDSFTVELRKLDHRRLLSTNPLAETINAHDVDSALMNGAYRRSKGGVAIRPEVDDDDAHNFAFKVDALHQALTPTMLQALEKVRDKSPLTEFDRECIAIGVDVNVLRDLKAAFSMVYDGVQGVTESAFLSSFCPALCENLTPEEIRLWFRNLDENCSGSVSWPEIADYLSKYQGDKGWSRPYFFEPAFEAYSDPTAESATKLRGHKSLVSKMLYNSSLDLIYTCALDGLVCAWNPHTLQPSTRVHALGSPVLDVSLCHHNNRLLVLQGDGAIFVYDTYTDVLGHANHTLFRGFAGKAARTLQDGTSVYDTPKAAQRKIRAVIPVSLISEVRDRARCIDNLGGISSHGEPIVVGTESGALQLYELVLGKPKPIVPFATYSPHQSWVTSVRFLSNTGGILTSSLDGTCCVTDVETGVLTQSMRLDGRRRRKPVYVTAYTPQNNTFITAIGRSIHLWNALTGARLTTMSDHERAITSIAINPERQHVYAMQDNKCLKVWDLRTWRIIDEITDSTRRMPLDVVSCVSWCESSNLVVAASTSLFGWRPLDIQERLDAGLDPHEPETRIHLKPIVSMHCLPRAGQIWSVDHDRCFVWGAEGKHRLKLWSIPFEDKITCSCMSSDELKAVVGTEAGRVVWINYANGYTISELKHALGAHHVNQIIITAGVVDTAPPLTFAVMGRCALAWSTDKNMQSTVDAPLFDYLLDPSIPGQLETITEVDPERKLLSVAATYGHIIILNVGLAPLHLFSIFGIRSEVAVQVTDQHPTVHCALVPLPGLLLFGCSDGSVRCVALRPGDEISVAPLLSIRAALRAEPITCMYSRDRQLICGDGDGAVMVFDCKRLLDPAYLSKTILPSLMDEFSLRKIQRVCDNLTELVVAFRAHTSAVIGMGMVSDNELITASSDKHIRAWRCEGEYPCIADVGRVKAEPLPVIEASRSLGLTDDSKLPPIGSLLTNIHPFHDVMMSIHPPQRKNIAATEFLAASEFAPTPVELPPAQVGRNTPHVARVQRSRRQSTVSLPPLMASPPPQGASILRTVASEVSSLNATPVISTVSRPGSSEQSQRAFAAAQCIRRTPKPTKATGPTVSLSALECFRRSTDRALRMRKTLVREEPYVNPVRDVVDAVEEIRQHRLMEVRDTSKRAFSMLTMAPIVGNPFVRQQAKKVVYRSYSSLR